MEIDVRFIYLACGFTKLEVLVPFLRLNKWRMFETTSQLRWFVEIYLSYFCCGYWYNRTICHIVYIYTTYHITSYHYTTVNVDISYPVVSNMGWGCLSCPFRWIDDSSSLCDVNHGNNCCCCGHRIDKSLQCFWTWKCWVYSQWKLAI